MIKLQNKKESGEKMNRKGLVRGIAAFLRDNNIRKPVAIPKKTLHISDDDGNVKDIVIKGMDKQAPFTVDDVETIIDTCLYVIQESLKKGEPVTIQGFGSLGLKYRKARSTKKIGTTERQEIPGRYIPKFSFGNDLRVCAKLYELSLNDAGDEDPTPVDDGGDG